MGQSGQSDGLQFYQSNEKFIGGFPVKFCSFAPEYHKI